ncbi:MAG: hypothetical protein IPG60_15810 [Bacteroidetes bacterium]|nr:hypothetical protein [Bacteroidota bacterium]MBP8754852.1 hypothetical protein [Chitinophagales bacterium]MBK7107760.1 hypothetical protein [Bacteroidota bacterium]MBK8681295.1 hypothetical protein [Bacteroidota bacterium]MBP9190590.1 hypothetical protein [Chitinophagales bacterium]
MSNYSHKLKVFLSIAASAICILIYSSCGNKNKIKTPDVSNIPVDVHFIRFDQSLMQANGRNYVEVIDSLKELYPEFFTLYTNNVLNIPLKDSSYNIYDTLYSYMISDKYMLRLYDSVQHIYSNMSDVEADVAKAFQYYKYYFPDSTLPQVFTYIAPFVYQVVLGDDVIGVELNMFLGKNFSYYSSFAANLPKYLLYRFRKENIPVSIMLMLADGSVTSLGANASLLDDMLYEGKQMYYLDLVLPKVADSVKIGFNKSQIEWCENNEADIWKFFAGEELLFSKRMQDKQQYIGEAPTTKGMPEESPGRVAIWMGWQIIRKYMHNNPNITIQQLFADTASYEILRKSNYSPGN